MQGIKIIFIDWYKTLCSQSVFWNLPYEREKMKKIAAFLFNSEGEMFYPWMRGQIERSRLIAKLCERERDLDPETVEKWLIEGCKILQLDSPQFIELIGQLQKQGKKVVLATDNMDFFTEYTVPIMKLDELFDDVLSSNQLGYIKKDREGDMLPFFDDCLKRNGCAYREAVLFDDLDCNLDAVSAVGMNSIKVTKPQDLIDGLNGLLKGE